ARRPPARRRALLRPDQPDGRDPRIEDGGRTMNRQTDLSRRQVLGLGLGCGLAAAQLQLTSADAAPPDQPKVQPQVLGPIVEEPKDPLTTFLPVAATPLVALRFVFQAGAEDDPKGKEGLAALTAAM